MKKNFGELWEEAKRTMHGHWGAAVLICFCVNFLSLIANFIPCIGGISQLLLFPLQAGLMLYFLRLSRQQEADFGTVFQPFQQYGRWLWGILRVGLFTLLWTLLLIVPGIIAGLRYSMTFFLLLDHPEMPVRDAMNASSRMMYGSKMRLFGCGVIFTLLFWASLFTLGIALLWLVPWGTAFLVHFYRDLAEAPAVAEEDPAR